jgi:hypothetical protein
MEDLMELVAASFARNGIRCPGDDPKLDQRLTDAPIQAGTDGFIRPANSSPAVVSVQTNVQSNIQSAGHAAPQTMRPAGCAPLPEHNYRKSSQAISP